MLENLGILRDGERERDRDRERTQYSHTSIEGGGAGEEDNGTHLSLCMSFSSAFNPHNIHPCMTIPVCYIVPM